MCRNELRWGHFKESIEAFGKIRLVVESYLMHYLGSVKNFV